jgi:hypothetical protein
MAYEEFTSEFAAWWNDLSEDEQEEIAAKVELLENAVLLCRAPMRIVSKALATPI